MDEAGRGPIAGPVAVGAVLVNTPFLKRLSQKRLWWHKINDSKKLSPQERDWLYRRIAKELPWGVGMASAKYIDRHGIKKAIKKAARLAVRNLGVKPEIVLQDGNQSFLKIKNCSHRIIIQGDNRLWSIACASILAKVTRDRFMGKIARRYPKYNFQKHKGYGTRSHVSLLKKHGPCCHHRYSFAPLKNRARQKSSDKN